MDLKQNKDRPNRAEERACFMALEKGDIDTVKDFINQYGVDAPVDDGTCLHQAIFHENYELVNFLISAGANPDALYENRITPLIAAIDLKQWDIATLLVEKGANVNLKDGASNSALSKAIFHYNGDDKLIKLLLSKGADPFQDLLNGYKPIDLARSMNLTEILKLLTNEKT